MSGISTLEKDNLLRVIARYGERIAKIESMLQGQQVGTVRIADAAITTAKIQDLSVTNAKIKDLSVTNAKIVNLTWDKGQGGTLKLGGFNNVNGVLEIYNSSDDLKGTWDKDGITVLSGLITGATITSSLFRTASSGNRIEIDANLISGQPAVKLINSNGDCYIYNNNGDFDFEGGDVFCEASLRVNDTVWSESGTLHLDGTVKINGNIQPNGNDSKEIGYSNSYFNQIVGNHIFYKSIGSFDKHDDLGLIKAIQPKMVTHKEKKSLEYKEIKKGKKMVQVVEEMVDVQKEIWDEATMPKEVMKDGFFDAGMLNGLLVGSIKQIIDRLEAIEKKIKL